jgi:hypothetical protein
MGGRGDQKKTARFLIGPLRLEDVVIGKCLQDSVIISAIGLPN